VKKREEVEEEKRGGGGGGGNKEPGGGGGGKRKRGGGGGGKDPERDRERQTGYLGHLRQEGDVHLLTLGGEALEQRLVGSLGVQDGRLVALRQAAKDNKVVYNVLQCRRTKTCLSRPTMQKIHLISGALPSLKYELGLFSRGD